MKYKDRKHAKRKYKQALLATVATMTLGVSTLGSTASVFAAEDTGKTTVQAGGVLQPAEPLPQQQPQMAAAADDASTLPMWAQVDKKIQDLGKTTGAANYKVTLDFVSKALPVLYKDLRKGNYNNTLRTLSMTASALIPYGGALISPMLGILWPENGKEDPMKELVKQMGTMMDQKITDYDVDTLKPKVKRLQEKAEWLEKQMNTEDNRSGFYSAGSIEETRRHAAQSLETAFKDVIAEASKDKYKESELPIYVTIATAHMNFLKFMEINGKKSEFQIDDKTMKTLYLADKEEFAKKHYDYVDKVSQTIADKIATNYKTIVSGDGPFAGLVQPTFDEINKLNRERQQELSRVSLALTVNNPAFLEAVGRSSEGYEAVVFNAWKTINNKWYYYDNDGLKKIGWHQAGTKYYYLSVKDGTKNSAGTTFNKGEMVTGWIKAADRWYYLSKGNEQNYDKTSFNEGEMMTGWVEQNGKWYYLVPNKEGRKGASGKVFAQGAAITSDELSVQDKNGNYIPYNFDQNGVATKK
ncbi:insecticidal delta-endotoxin Cry8Ea1 family protein [Bacillus cereus]|uniref:insecticidal delta-endotoxin Cry8Ea1 family protein n=1 Tax=Bacillus cereus TaxID=1396 RepID=UPI0018F4C2E8|nr:insecticidal delta-endotoxin Cry8Ea1 family protein [Bacillus cereus]MBJ8026011.1 hypothetical protein [Bacillus cereus]MBJ8038294.1 hypothetical protein [Bacillus cereus]